MVEEVVEDDVVEEDTVVEDVGPGEVELVDETGSVVDVDAPGIVDVVVVVGIVFPSLSRFEPSHWTPSAGAYSA